MTTARMINALNRLLAILYRSLPMYLADAFPWHRSDDEIGQATLRRIQEDQRQMAQRIAEAILDRRGPMDTGEFPMEFTDTQFLSFDFLVQEMIRHQRQDIAAIEQCVRDLADDRAARELAEEALGAERAHLEALEELTSQPA